MTDLLFVCVCVGGGGGGGGGRVGSGRSPNLSKISCNPRYLQIKMDRINNREKVETPFFSPF